MANITEEHLHHFAKRHHHTMRKFDALKGKVRGVTERFIGTLEVGAGAYLGGVVDGRTNNGTVMHVPISLGVGALALAAGHLDLAGDEWSGHLNNLGNGFVANYLSAVGHNFGSRWRASGRLFGSKAAPAPLPAPAPAVASGDLSDAQMAEIVRRMQAAAAGGA